MTLSVHVYTADENGKMRDVLDDPGMGAELAGFERWRRTVWGSPTVRSLGARFFPQLDGGDLYVTTDELPAFIEECALLRANLDAFPEPDGWLQHQDFGETVSTRLANIEAAAGRALELGACVVIW